MNNYEVIKVRGYWKDTPKEEQDVNIAKGYWEEIETEDFELDDQIFYYIDLEYDEKPNIEIGDVISDGFIITQVYDNQKLFYDR